MCYISIWYILYVFIVMLRCVNTRIVIEAALFPIRLSIIFRRGSIPTLYSVTDMSKSSYWWTWISNLLCIAEMSYIQYVHVSMTIKFNYFIWILTNFWKYQIQQCRDKKERKIKEKTVEKHWRVWVCTTMSMPSTIQCWCNVMHRKLPTHCRARCGYSRILDGYPCKTLLLIST